MAQTSPLTPSSLVRHPPSARIQTSTNITLDTWSDEEVTLQHLTAAANNNNSSASLPPNLQASLSKITTTCALALARDNLDYAWVDTCCIDKTNSAELSEAINSMFAWYRDAAVCYVFLADLEPGSRSDLERALPECRWFTRGWTLQELVAPREVVFFDREWGYRGEKMELELTEVLERITGISKMVLKHASVLEEVAVARRMLWAAWRETTRGEDMAYCLMGLFDVNMPLLYGEGMAKAFARLQMAIVQSTGDLSIFAWVDDRVPCPEFAGLLAESPRQFATCGHIEKDPDNQAYSSFAITSRGIQTEAVLVHNPRARDGEWILALHTFCHMDGSTVVVPVQRIGDGVCVRRNPGARALFGDQTSASTVAILDSETLTLATRLPPSVSLYYRGLNPVLGSRRSALCVNWGPLELEHHTAMPRSNWDAHDEVLVDCTPSTRAWGAFFVSGMVDTGSVGQQVFVSLFLACFGWRGRENVTVVLASLDNLSPATSTFMRSHLASTRLESFSMAKALAIDVFEGKLEKEVISTDLGAVTYLKDSARRPGGVKPVLTVVNMRPEIRPGVCINPVIVLDISYAIQ